MLKQNIANKLSHLSNLSKKSQLLFSPTFYLGVKVGNSDFNSLGYFWGEGREKEELRQINEAI